MPGCSSRARIWRSASKRSQVRRRFALQELDRDALLEVSLGAAGFAHVAHAAAADELHDAPGAEAQSRS